LENYLTQDFTFDQLVRLERATALFIQGKIDRDAFIKSLILPLERGGVEVEEKEARRMANVASKMIENSDDIRRYRARKENDGIFFSQHKLAERLREHLTQVYRIKLSKDQEANMTELIADRVTGVTEEDEMNARMMKGIRSGGLALSEGEADDLTRDFEKVIAQGVDVSYKN
jgi:hypothetical protein